MQRVPKNVYLCDETALQLLRCWSYEHAITVDAFHHLRLVDTAHLPARCLRRKGSPHSCAERRADLEDAFDQLPHSSVRDQIRSLWAQASEERPLHVMACSSAGKNPGKGIRIHAAPPLGPLSGFLELAPGLMVTSPELLFVQMGTSITLGEHLALGYELCGCYPHSDRPGFVRAPLTSPSLLEAFIRRVKNVKGLVPARRALRFIRAKSASPMETEVSALISTSVKWGGFGLSGIRLNERVKLSRQAARMAKTSVLTLDAFWPDGRVALEYEGRDAHGKEDQRIRDSRRRDALSADGIELLTLTSPQFSSYAEFETIVERVRLKAGKRHVAKPKDFPVRHGKLRWQLRQFHQRGDESGQE